MFDIRLIRENPDAFDSALARRGAAPEAAGLLELDTARRSLQTELNDMQSRRNALSKEIGQIRRQGGDAAEETRTVAEIKDEMTRTEERLSAVQEELEARLLRLPNMLDPSVPEGASEADNVEVRRHGTPRSFDFTPRDHVDLGTGLGAMDFEAAARLSGARFVVLKGQLARLERALGQFMLDLHTSEHGYQEIQTPALVRRPALVGTGQLPKFEEDLFHMDPDYYLIPTSEVTMTNLVREQILPRSALPLRMTALTQCFRAEAGAAGRDTRGMIRQHQFNKVEMVSIVAPEESDAELERMTGCAEAVLQKLGLPYRVVALCSGDVGFSARRTYDLEVWLPGQDTYREISSCSNCGDFQARRMEGRFRNDGEKGTSYVHTLNGSGVAVGRALVAVMENGQNEDGSITVPEVLRPYMGGCEVIRPQ
ncbi:serine--tRNA ligase [Phaeovibrio sulfidiphilus]|uniref:Serine--tRNA ligase n=1 Tax=Phaeovibrio sulfidiphilus TaxID=1220600 RepID=A0A8J6YMQ6_9PROT|nr:serine--tRNA ligase [Phaeovibrio sulfidiphilus]MBE1236161.1 serine--tRNA ligase [Phaeovibrio sulfidiphilus]